MEKTKTLEIVPANKRKQTMVAARLYGPGDIRVVECAVPDVGPRQLLIRVSAAAICGSDLRMIENGYRGVGPESPLTLGHEFSGYVAQTGAEVAGYPVGTRVAVAPNMGCGTCDFCVSGNTHLCPGYEAFGINLDGAFAEYVLVPEKAIAQGNLVVLDPGTDLEQAAVIEPYSCVMNGQEHVRVGLGDTVLVIGAGPIGLMHAQLAGIRGAARVLICDLSRERAERAAAAVPGVEALGAERLRERIWSMTGGSGVDVCITACPSGAIQSACLELMAMNGRVLFFGGLPQGRDRVTLETNLIHYRQLEVCGSTRGNITQYRQVAKMASSGRIDLGAFLSARFPLGSFPKAVAYARSGKGIKTLVTMGGEPAPECG